MYPRDADPYVFQLPFHIMIPAINIFYAPNNGHPPRRNSSNNKASNSSKIRARNICTRQTQYARNDGDLPAGLDACPHSSETYSLIESVVIDRFSNFTHTTCSESSTMNCGCKSVGKAGYGPVRMSTGNGCLTLRTITELSDISMKAPTALSLSMSTV